MGGSRGKPAKAPNSQDGGLVGTHRKSQETVGGGWKTGGVGFAPIAVHQGRVKYARGKKR